MRRCTWSVQLVELVAVLLSAVIGGLALATPVSLEWARGGTATMQIELLATNMPRAAAIGCIAAVVITVFTSSAESTIVPWAAALAGTVVLLVNHQLGPRLSSVAPLSTLTYLDTLAAGILLGGLAAAAAVRTSMMLAFLLGILISVVIGEVSVFAGLDVAPHGLAAWFVDSPPLWLLWPGTALLGWCTARARLGKRLTLATGELPLGPILAAVIAVSVPVFGSEWMVRHGTTVGEIVLVTVASVVATLMAGLLLPGRDGMLLQASITIGAVGSVIVPLPLPAWMIPLSLIANAVGMSLGRRWAMPFVAMLALLALAVFAVVAATPGNIWPGAAIGGTLALGLATGYSFAATLPSHSPSVMLGVAVLFVPGVVIALRGRMFTTDPDSALDNSTPGLIALAVAAGCTINVILLRKRSIAVVEPVLPPAVAEPDGHEPA
ncbi:hypothetical protein [Nocardia aurea]|uniref:Uncharacterized protein n=1 Tax=Nocardia aurea TaxID=2144174 RepID=A0ABV3FTC6_9NOCA